MMADGGTRKAGWCWTFNLPVATCPRHGLHAEHRVDPARILALGTIAARLRRRSAA